MTRVTDSQVFNYLEDNDKLIDWNKPDYTGANADYYLNKYVNRPEDAGNLKDFQKTLSDIGIAAPPADALNAAIFAVQGEWGNAALSAAAIIPAVGEVRQIQKLLKKSGEKMITLYRGVDKWYPGEMVKKGNFVGSSAYLDNVTDVGGRSAPVGGILGRQPTGTLWTSEVPQAARNYTKGKGPILEFQVPESFIKNFGKYRPAPGTSKALVAKHDIKMGMLGDYKYPIVAFPEGIPKAFLKNVYKNYDELEKL